MKPSSEVVELGRRLVGLLWQEGHRADLLGRWMAHDLAAKLTAADAPSATEADREACFSAIQAIWNHRYGLPPDRQPLADLAPILEGLARLDPSKRTSAYFQARVPPTGDAAEWMRVATVFDQIARYLIRLCLVRAAESAGEGVSWTELADGAGLLSPEFAVVRIIHSWDEPEPTPAEARAQRLRAELNDLKMFRRGAATLEKAIRAELETIGGKATSKARKPVGGDRPLRRRTESPKVGG